MVAVAVHNNGVDQIGSDLLAVLHPVDHNKKGNQFGIID